MATISASAVTAAAAALSRKRFDADLSSSASLFFRNHRAGLAMTSTKYSNRVRGMSCNCLFGLRVPELVVIAGATALVFGPKQLPEVGRGLGKTIKSFQKMNLLNLQLLYHDHFHCFRHCHQLIKLAPDARHLFLPVREPKLKQLVPFGAPYDSFSRGSRCESLDVNTFSIAKNGESEEEFEEYLAEDGEVYQKTLRLVECAMFAAISGLAFLLSNSLAIERYLACFFAFPIVLSTMRWGVAADRKTMVATIVLLFVLSGPVKAITYLLLHGLLGFTMGTIWRLKASWGTSVALCSMVRAVGALVNVLIASYLIGENILELITINVHTLFTFILSSMGIISVPSMNLIYFIFGFLLLLNCASFVFLLHLLYAVFFYETWDEDVAKITEMAGGGHR